MVKLNELYVIEAEIADNAKHLVKKLQAAVSAAGINAGGDLELTKAFNGLAIALGKSRRGAAEGNDENIIKAFEGLLAQVKR